MESSTGKTGADMILPNYKLGKTLHIDLFGKLKIGEHVLTGQKVAIKIVNCRKVKDMVQQEIEVLRLLSHPHVIRLYEVIETHSDIFLVMEYAKYGELFDYVIEKGRLKEDEACYFFQQIVSGVEYCHRNMVIHHDLKLEKMLLDSEHNIKITGFAFSNVMQHGCLMKTSYGSSIYAAPEVISGEPYAGPEVDVWGCGIILYALVCGSLPFDVENIPNLVGKIKGEIYALPSYLSSGVRDLISQMLVADPMKRITVPEICKHPWLQAYPCDKEVSLPDPMQQVRKDTKTRLTIRSGKEKRGLYLLEDSGSTALQLSSSEKSQINGIHLSHCHLGHLSFKSLKILLPSLFLSANFESL